MAMAELVEKRKELEAKQKALADVFAEAGDDLDMSKIKSIEGDHAAKAAKIKAMNDELTDLGKAVDELAAVEKAAENAKALGDRLKAPAGGVPHPEGGKGEPPTQHKSIGELFVESRAYKGFEGASGPSDTLDISLKTLFETSAGWAPETTRTGRIVDFATRAIQVTDLIPMGQTGQNAVVYMEETTFTNNAAEIDEAPGQDGDGDEIYYGEAALALTERNSPVRKIAVYLPVTDEQLEDVPQARGYVDRRLTFMLRQRLDGQILTGNGTAPNLTGILNVSGIQTQAKGSDPSPDAVYKAMTKVRVTGRAMPGAVIIHPNDWQAIRLLRTADGIYIWGSPSEAGPERIWGLPIAQSDAITENTALVGDFANFSELDERRGVDVQVSNSHSDFFLKGKQAIRADMRVALVIYRPKAFCTVTGL